MAAIYSAYTGLSQRPADPTTKKAKPVRRVVARQTQLPMRAAARAERDEKIAEMFKAGMSACAIAKKLGYSGADGVSKRLLALKLRPKSSRGFKRKGNA